MALGAGVGAGVLVSRYFGARNYSKMKTIVSTSLISFLILSILLGIFGFGLSHSMMGLLQTPADILDEAVLYLRVYFVGFPFLFMYNILSTMFNSIGESKIPLGLLIFSSILNIFMEQKQTSLVFTEYPKLYLPMTVSRIFPVMRRSYTV